MSNAFERVARARGVDVPKARRGNLHVVPSTEDTQTPVEPAENDSERPTRFNDIVGQGELLMRLGTHLKAAVARGTQPGHILLDGGPGLGKTTIGQAVSGELREEWGQTSRFREITGDAIGNQRKLAVELSRIEAGDIWFIDEIQTLKPAVQTALLRVLEDGVLFVEGNSKGPAVKFDVPPFTLVGATTHPGKLSRPLRDRFKFTGHLEPYDFDDMQLVLLGYAERLGIDLEFEAAEIIAHASRYTPRRGIILLGKIRDYAFDITDDHDAVIDVETALQGLEYWGVDQYGLEARDKRYLGKLVKDFMGGPVGATTLASVLNMDATEIHNDIEPYLHIAGLLARGQSGRCATRATYVVLGLPVPPMINGNLR